ncbi:ATP-binding protein, partial [Haloarcula marismortui]
TIKDWMTTLKTATESNPEYESENNEENDVESPETIETLFEHLEDAEVPTAFQVVFQARRDWSDEAQDRKQSIRSGDFSQPWLEKYVLGGYETDEDRDLKAYEYRRIKLIENKRPKKTFNANVRAVSFTPYEEFTPDPDTATPLKDGSMAAADEALGSLKPLFDPLDGVYYHVVGETAPRNEATGTDLTASEVAQNFMNHDLVTREDRRSWVTPMNLWNDPKKRPELILNADELSDFIIIPSGEDMDGDAFRSAGTTDADANHLRRPRPQIHNQLTGGMDIGYAFDEDGIPEEEPTSVPENVLTNHWLKVGASGAGKTINTIGMLLSLHENVDGPTILVDPKSGDMVENYAKSHAATFDELRNVQIFDVPEVLPAIPFFDIRPYLHEGMNRDDAIQQKADEFHLIMEMVDENYGTAYVAQTVLGALIKSQFDREHGADSYTLDELYDTAVEMYADQTVPRVSHQPQVRRILSNQLNNAEQDFKNTMQAVINRLDDLQEDINLFRLFNQNPDWDEETGSYEINDTTREGYKKAQENDNVDDDEIDPPKSALDFREVLESDKVILFDTGDFVRDQSQQAFSMYILSALWGAVRSRYNDRKSHESIDNTVNLVIEEAAPIVSTELVTNTLIPEAREFGLSLGMVMQFPEQVRKHSDSDTYNELITNVQTKIIGQLEPDQRIVESLVHGDKDSQEIRNKIRQLSGGEWIADLPAPQFGADVPPPFSIKSLGIPDGHPESDEAFDEQERTKFYALYEQRQNYVANRHGYVRPSAEEIAKRESAGDAIGFGGSEEDDGEDGEGSAPSPGVPATDSDSQQNERGTESGTPTVVGSGGDDGSDGEIGLGAAVGDESSAATNSATGSEPADDSEASVNGQATDTGEDTAPTGPDSETPDFGAYAPLSKDDIEEVCGEIAVDEHSDLANMARELLTSLPEEEYYRSMVALSHIAGLEGMEMKPVELHKSAKQQASDDAVDTETMEEVSAPTGESTPHASDVDEGDDGRGDDTTASDTGAVAGGGTGDGTDSEATESDDGDEPTPTPQRTGGNSSEDTPESDGRISEDITKNMFTGNEPDEDEQQTEDSEDDQQTVTNQDPFEPRLIQDEDGDRTSIDLTDDDEQEAEDTDSEHPSNVSLTTPLPEAYADFNLERHDDHEFSADDKEFMALIASAFRDELDWYSLTDSMTDVRDRAGDPDVDALIECEYIDETTVQRKKYYSLTRKGWRVVGDSVPGNEFGDHMEKMEHRVGVHLLTKYIAERDDVAWAEPYAQYEGETYDVVGYDNIGTILVTGEVETESNNPAAVAEDYEKLSDAPGDVIWAHPAERDFSAIWEMVNQHVLDEELSVTTIDRTAYLREYLEDNELSGVDDVKTYSQLKDSE